MSRCTLPPQCLELPRIWEVTWISEVFCGWHVNAANVVWDGLVHQKRNKVIFKESQKGIHLKLAFVSNSGGDHHKKSKLLCWISMETHPNQASSQTFEACRCGIKCCCHSTTSAMHCDELSISNKKHLFAAFGQKVAGCSSSGCGQSMSCADNSSAQRNQVKAQVTHECMVTVRQSPKCT